MTTRQKLELAINQPTEITLLYNEPIVGKSQFGDYNMYAVAVGDDEFSFFAPAEVHAELSKLGKGQTAIVTKLAAQRGSKVVTTYDVKVPDRNEAADTKEELDSSIEEEVKDPFFDLMLQSYKDALDISKKLNGMANPEKIAVTLFIARSKSNSY